MAIVLISRRKRVGAEDGGELRPEDLDGDLAVVLQVVREIDSGHATRAELALDAVAVGKDGAEAAERVGHWPQVTCGSRLLVARAYVAWALLSPHPMTCHSVSGTARQNGHPAPDGRLLY